MRKSSLCKGLLCSGGAIFALAACPAFAQVADPAAADEAALESADDSGTENIIVTARKRAESITDIPVALTALSGQEILDRGIDDFVSLQDFTPGFRFQNQSVNRNDRGFKTFIMRGMFPGTDLPDRQAASVFFNGVPVAGGAIPGLAGIERVEVVPGPQSAYFGRSTFAGAVNFITAAPSFDLGVDASASYASYDRQEYTLSVEGGIVPDLLSARISGRVFRIDGPFDNFGYEEFGDLGELGAQRTVSGAAEILLTLAHNLDIRTIFNYWEDRDGPPATGQLYMPDHNCNAGAAPAGTLNYICGQIERVPADRMTQNVLVPSFVVDTLRGTRGTGTTLFGPDFSDHFGLKREAYHGALLMDYDVNGYTFSLNGSISDNKFRVITDTSFRDNRDTVNPSYSEGSELVPYRSRTVLTEWRTETWSLEGRVASPSSRSLRLLLGGNLFHQKLTSLTSIFGDTGYLPVQPESHATVDTTGLFGAIEYDFTPDLSINVEARYQWDTIGTNVPSRPNATAEETFESFSPRIILNYEPTDNSLLYASYSRGTRPGAFNTALLARSPTDIELIREQIDAPLAVPEERVEMFELGFKGDFFDGRLRLLSAIYYGRWRDKQVVQQVFYFNPTLQGITLVTSGGKVDLYGLELTANMELFDGFTVDGTFNIAETEIRATSCRECEILTGDPNPTGTRLPRYPAYTGSLVASYNWDVTPDWRGFLSSSYIYTGKMYDTEANLAHIGPAHRVNIRAGIERSRVRAELFVENLFDDETPNNLSRNVDTFTGANTITVSPPLPRVVGGRLSYRF